MKKTGTLRRPLAALLAACMLLTLLPLSALAVSYSVTYSLNGLEAFAGDKAAAKPATVSGMLAVTIFPEDGYKLPDESSLVVTMGNSPLPQGSGGYMLQPVKKNGSEGPSGWAIGIMNVTGDVMIKAEGVALKSDATLKSISYSYSNGEGETLNYNSNKYSVVTQERVYDYDVELPYSINNKFVYVFESEDKRDQSQTFDSDWWRTYGGITLDEDGKKTAALTVKAESGSTQVYTVNFTTAAPPVTNYDVWVGGTRITSENASDVLGDGKVSYDATSTTLTLNGASITGTHIEAGIFAENAALTTIVLTGENVIGDAGSAELNCGIMNYNNPASTATNSALTIKGGGKLTVYLKRARNLGVSGVSSDKGLTLDGVSLEVINKDGKDAIAVQPRTYNGLGADEGLTVKNGAQITLTDLWEGIIASSGAVSIAGDSTVSITTAGSSFNAGTVSIGSATVDVESTLADQNAIIADNIAISDGAHVTAKSKYPALYAINGINITGGTVNAASTTNSGIYSPGSLTISGSGTQVTANGYYAGLQAVGDVTISGGTVNAASTNDCGIFTNATLAISGDTTEVTASSYYAGLRGNTGITISGGTVDAVSTNDIGIFSTGTIAITGGSVHAKGGTGWAAIAARTVKSGEEQPPLTIVLTGMAEENSCIPKASDWFNVSLSSGGTEDRSWSSFVPADAGELTVTNGAMTNAVNEVRLAPPMVTAVNITPATAIVQKGTTRQFSAEVIGTYLPTRNVTWSIESNHADGTTISDTGLLTVASDETQATLTVKAASTVASGKSGTATVIISDKTILTDSQINLTMDGWTYGETAKSPNGSVTVAEDNGVISYQYSADGGTTWINTLPTSTAGVVKAGAYLVKMNYEGNAYIGSKTAEFTVARKPVTLGVGTLTASKTYDGDRAATLTGLPALTGVLGGDTVAATGGSGVYATANAGTNIAVIVTGFTLTGADTDNYTTDGTVSGLTGAITPADGKIFEGYADALAELQKVHIVTNVTPTLKSVTLPAGWVFTGDEAELTARLSGKSDAHKQMFSVRYTPPDPNYGPVDLAPMFPVSTVALAASEGLEMKIVEAGQQLTLSGVTLQVTGAPLPNEGDYAIANMKWSSSVEAVATVTGEVSGNSNMSATVAARKAGVTMVGVAYQSGDMLGYVLVKVTGGEGTANQVSDIKDIAETLDKLIDPENPTPTDKKAVDAVADEVTRLSDTDKENLTLGDIQALDELKTAVGERISDDDSKLNIKIEKEAEEEHIPAPTDVQVVGAAIACGVDSGDVVVTVKPVQPSGSNTKLELKMELTVNGTEKPLEAPMFFQMEVPDGIDLSKLTLYHVKDDGAKTKIPFERTAGTRTISFKMLSFSSVQFVVTSGGTSGGTTGGTSGGSSGGGDRGDSVYTLTATAGAGGGIAPSGKVRVSRNDDKTFTITPDEGYEIADVLVDGKSVGAVDTYTFERVRADHTIAARFRAEDERPAWNPFTDVAGGDWYYDGVKYVYERGLMNGTGQTTFSPGVSTTRGMIVTILWRLEDEQPGGAAMTFEDVKAGSYCYEAVRWAAGHEIVKGYTAAAFGPDDPITRQELAVILYRYAQYKGRDVSAAGDLTAFADRPDFWAEDAVRWAVGEGILSGKVGGILDPWGQASRAEVAVVLHRLLAGRN